MHRQSFVQSPSTTKQSLDALLTECWAKNMTVSSAFSLARTKGYSVTYKQVHDSFNKKLDAFDKAFACLFH